MITNILMCVLGILFMTGGFYAIALTGGIRSSRNRPYRSISKAGRAIIFLAGMAVFVDGLAQILNRTTLFSKGWSVAVPIAGVVLLALFLNSQTVRAFMGRRRVNHPVVVIDFPNGLPPTMVGMRITFFVIVAAMVVFGELPMSGSIANAGVIFSAIALLALGGLYAALEYYYVKTGRGKARAFEYRYVKTVPERAHLKGENEKR